MAKREQNCKWCFADQPLGGQDVGPNNAMAQNFKKHPYASLVRESIQNSLDAVADKSKPVRVVYSFKNMRWADYPEFYKIKVKILEDTDFEKEAVLHQRIINEVTGEEHNKIIYSLFLL